MSPRLWAHLDKRTLPEEARSPEENGHGPGQVLPKHKRPVSGWGRSFTHSCPSDHLPTQSPKSHSTLTVEGRITEALTLKWLGPWLPEAVPRHGRPPHGCWSAGHRADGRTATELEAERPLLVSLKPETPEQESWQMSWVTKKRADVITEALRGAGVFTDHSR